MLTNAAFGLAVGLFVGALFMKAAIVDLRARVARLERALNPEPEPEPDDDSLYE